MDKLRKEAPEGYIYTNGVAYGKVLVVKEGTNLDNWYLITEEEYEAILAKQGESEII